MKKHTFTIRIDAEPRQALSLLLSRDMYGVLTGVFHVYDGEGYATVTATEFELDGLLEQIKRLATEEIRQPYFSGCDLALINAALADRTEAKDKSVDDAT